MSFLFQTRCIETALWPVLYPFERFCESAIEDTGKRESAKFGYILKMTCEVYDYCGSFDLLRYQYDRWMHKTLSGAVAAGQSKFCSPARALDGKVFSPTFWEWQFTYLVDAVTQLGYPDIFITISPYEWTFPYSAGLLSRMEQLGRAPTELPTLETMHVAHILEQILRGYVSGKGQKEWNNNLLRAIGAGGCNVTTYFYR